MKSETHANSRWFRRIAAAVSCAVLACSHGCSMVHSQSGADPFADRSDQILYLAQTLFLEGKKSLALGHYSEAIRQFRGGIKQLGSAYHNHGSLDDTGQRVALAMVEEENGRLRVAAHLLKNALATRIGMFERGRHNARSRSK